MKEFAQQGRSWQGKMEAGADGWVPERMLFHSLSPKPSVVLHGPCISQESLISEDLLDSFYPRRTQSFLG